jgi:hypothetical protein
MNTTTTNAKDWLRFGECVDLARERGVSRKVFLKLLEATKVDPKNPKKRVPLIESRVFPGCTRRHYGRASVIESLQSGGKP